MGKLSALLSSVNKALDMSKAARMQRALEQGYRPETYYHGSATPDISAFEVERAGTVQRSDWGEGVYITPSRMSAKYYAEEAASRTQDEVGEKLWADYENKARELGTSPMMEAIDLGFGSEKYNELLEFTNRYRAHKDAFREQNKGHVYELLSRAKNPKYYQYEGITDPTLAGRAREQGHDAVYITRRPDPDLPEEPIEDRIEEIVVLDPSVLRRKDAAFDPDLKDSPNLLASAAPFAVGLGAMVQSDDSEAKMQLLPMPSGKKISPTLLPAQTLGTIEAQPVPFFGHAANYLDKVELPVVGKPFEGLARWARNVGYQDTRENQLKRAAMAALDLL